MKGPIEYIKESWKIYTKKENFIFFAKIMAVILIVTLPLGYLLSYLRSQNNDLMLILVGILAALVGIWVSSTKYVSIIKMGSPEKEVFKLGFKMMWVYFLLSIVLGLIILGGLILLIIPAIIFGVWYSFSIFLLFDKNIGIKEALRQSKNMVKGRFWKVLGRSLVFGLITLLVNFVFASIPYAGNIIVSFLAPVFILPSYLLYRDLVLSN